MVLSYAWNGTFVPKSKMYQTWVIKYDFRMFQNKFQSEVLDAFESEMFDLIDLIVAKTSGIRISNVNLLFGRGMGHPRTCPEIRTLVVYLLRLKLPRKMRRWSQVARQLSIGSDHPRIFMSISGRTIYTTYITFVRRANRKGPSGHPKSWVRTQYLKFHGKRSYFVRLCMHTRECITYVCNIQYVIYLMNHMIWFISYDA